MNKFNFKSLGLVLLGLLSGQALLGATGDRDIRSLFRKDGPLGNQVVVQFSKSLLASLCVNVKRLFLDVISAKLINHGDKYFLVKISNSFIKSFLDDVIAQSTMDIRYKEAKESKYWLLRTIEEVAGVFADKMSESEKEVLLSEALRLLKQKFKDREYFVSVKIAICEKCTKILDKKYSDGTGNFVVRDGKIAFKPNESASRDSARVKPPKPGRRKPISPVPSAALSAEAPPATVEIAPEDVDFADEEVLGLLPGGSLVPLGDPRLGIKWPPAHAPCDRSSRVASVTAETPVDYTTMDEVE